MRRECDWAVILAGLACFIVAETAAAQVHPLRVLTKECVPAGCRLAESRGSAVAIGRHEGGQELFLTAGHCVRGSAVRVEVGIHQKWHRADVLGVAMDGGRDLAVLRVNPTDGPLPCAAVAEAEPAAGAAVVVAGFPGGAGFRHRDGVIALHQYRDVDLVIDVPTLPGESGGGIFARDGALVGIISATGPLPRPEHTLATGAGRIREFLRQRVGGVPACRPKRAAPDQPSQATEFAALSMELEALKRRLVELEAQVPVAGPAGPPGPPGERGPPGPAAEIGALQRQLDELRGTRIPVQILAADGTVVDEASYRLGEVIRLRLAPKPARIQDRR